jgi:hypothetical protein
LPDENAITPARRCSGVNCASALVLALEEERAAAEGVGRSRSHHRRAVRDAREPLGRSGDVVEGDGEGHVRSLIGPHRGGPSAPARRAGKHDPTCHGSICVSLRGMSRGVIQA